MLETFNTNAREDRLSLIDQALVNKVLRHVEFQAIFANPHIPVDPKREDKADIHGYVQSIEEKERLARLAIFLATEGGQVLSDFDGTLSAFVNDPENSAIDPDANAGLVRLQTLGMLAAFVTGRKPDEMALMATPQENIRVDDRGELVSREPIGDVISATGETVLAAGNQLLLFPIMASHGTSLQMPDKADGSRPALIVMQMTDDEIAFIRLGEQLGVELKQKFPAMGIQNKGTNGINIDVGKLPEDKKGSAIAEVRGRLKALIEDTSLNPAIDGKPAFEMADESDFESCIRSTRFTKAYAITEHGLVDIKKPTLFLCDSLGKEGTDGGAAIRINNDFPLGFVLHVRNDREVCLPLPGSAQTPFASFANPNQLGRFLQFMAGLKETNFRLLEIQSKPSRKSAISADTHTP